MHCPKCKFPFVYNFSSFPFHVLDTDQWSLEICIQTGWFLGGVFLLLFSLVSEMLNETNKGLNHLVVGSETHTD